MSKELKDCPGCWGSGWETQFITPCKYCNGMGKIEVPSPVAVAIPAKREVTVICDDPGLQAVLEHDNERKLAEEMLKKHIRKYYDGEEEYEEHLGNIKEELLSAMTEFANHPTTEPVEEKDETDLSVYENYKKATTPLSVEDWKNSKEFKVAIRGALMSGFQYGHGDEDKELPPFLDRIANGEFSELCKIWHVTDKDVRDVPSWQSKQGLSSPIGEWVSVEERLPELTEPMMIYDELEMLVPFKENYKATVLAYNSDRGIFKAEYTGRWAEISTNSTDLTVNPSHWMPLPNKPTISKK